MSDNMTSTALTLETDARYFEMGASVEKFPAGELAWMPGLERISSSAVLHRIHTGCDPVVHFPPMEQAAIKTGVPETRLYLHDRNHQWEGELTNRGYRMREEMVVVAEPQVRSQWPEYERLNMRTIVTEQDWQARARLFGADGKAPDGYGVDVEAYIEMEKRKTAGKQFTMLLFSDEHNQPVASVGIFILHPFARLKNLIVDHRRRGCGMASRMIAEIGRSPSYKNFALIAYEIPRTDRSSLYRRMNFRHVASCYEWRKKALS